MCQVAQPYKLCYNGLILLEEEPMETAVVASVQQRMQVFATREEFETQARRFLHQARAKSAQLVVFPELTGLMLAPPLISKFKLGFVKRADAGARPTASFLRRRLGRVSGAAADDERQVVLDFDHPFSHCVLHYRNKDYGKGVISKRPLHSTLRIPR